MKRMHQEETLNQSQKFLIGLMSVIFAGLFLSAAPVWAVPQDHDDPDPCEDCDPPEDPCEECEDGGSGGSEVRYYTGTVIQDPIDFSIPAPGFDLEFRRFHSSREPSGINEDLGIGWRHPYNIRLKFESGKFEPMVILRPYPGGSNELRYYENGDGTFGCVTPGYTSAIAQDTSNNNWIETFASRNKYIYNAAGWLIAQEDRNGNRLTISRDSNNLIQYIEDAVGRRLTFTNVSGRITKITDPINRTVEFGYDGNNNLATAKDRGGFTMTYTYDADRRISSKTREGRTWTYSFVGGRIESIVDPSGATTRFQYDPANRTTARIDARGETWTTQFTSFGQWERSVSPNGASTARTYDASRKLISITDPNGRIARFDRDDRGNVIRRVMPDGARTEFAYNSNGSLAVETSSLGTTVVTYDTLGRIVFIQRPDSGVHTWTYGSRGLISSQIDPDGRQSQRSYDIYGGLSSITDPSGFVTQFINDSVGRRIATINPDGARTSMSYDNWDRATEITNPLGDKSIAAWNAWDQTSIQDYRGSTTKFEYDKTSRLIAIVLPNGIRNQFSYDSTGNRTIRRDGRGLETKYIFDSVGGIISTVYPEVSLGTPTELFGYDTTGYISSRKNPLGQTTRFERDTGGRVIKIIYHDGSTAEIGYDSSGRRNSLISSAGTSSWTYDSASRIVSWTDVHDRTLNYSYTHSGLFSRIEAPSKSVAYFYDTSGLPVRAALNGENVNIQYNKLRRPERIEYPNGLATVITYDSASRVTRLHINKGDTALLVRSFVYDSMSAPILIVDTSVGIMHFQYGANGDLVREAFVDTGGDTLWHRAYSYDSSGNRIREENVLNGDSQIYLYDNDNRLIAFGDTTLAYDLAGNLLRVVRGDGSAIQYTWNLDFQLMSVVDTASGSSISFQYDADGRRTSRTDSGTTSQFLWTWISNAERPEALSLLSPEFRREFIWQEDQLASYVSGTLQEFFFESLEMDRPWGVLRSGDTLYFHYDQGIGNVIAVSDSRGVVVNRYQFSGFGFPLGRQEAFSNKKYLAGFPLDAPTSPSLYYVRARYYSPEIGRWINWDPLRQATGNNMYLYAGNKPTTSVDRTGLFPGRTDDCSYYTDQQSESDNYWEFIYYGNAYVACEASVAFGSPLGGPETNACIRSCLQYLDDQVCEDECDPLSFIACQDAAHYVCFTDCPDQTGGL